MKEAKTEGFTLGEGTYRALDMVDNMPPAYRKCVHEVGWEAVSIMMPLGLTPAQIKSVVYACWQSPGSAHQRRGFGQPVEERCSPVMQHLDTLLSRAGANISGAMLLAFLKHNGMVIVPLEPSSPMIEASMATVAGHDVRVTKKEKHRLRLKAALNASVKRLWPQLVGSHSAFKPFQEHHEGERL